MNLLITDVIFIKTVAQGRSLQIGKQGGGGVLGFSFAGYVYRSINRHFTNSQPTEGPYCMLDLYTCKYNCHHHCSLYTRTKLRSQTSSLQSMASAHASFQKNALLYLFLKSASALGSAQARYSQVLSYRLAIHFSWPNQNLTTVRARGGGGGIGMLKKDKQSSIWTIPG